MFRKSIFAIVATTILATMPNLASASGDGEKAFKKRCSSCHSVKPGEHIQGPSLAGIFGRQAGTIADYNGYDTLKGSELIWDEANLDGWITNPKKFIGKRTPMTGKVKKESERAAVIEYLKGL